ncbi:MAG TPA: hypothetical protein DIW39_00735 [Enterococcus faecalis]|nr:hypothetical protein [Enterococcus faecalis]
MNCQILINKKIPPIKYRISSSSFYLVYHLMKTLSKRCIKKLPFKKEKGNFFDGLTDVTH